MQNISRNTVSIILLSVFAFGSCSRCKNYENDTHIVAISSIIEEGDIVFRRGEGVVSRIVLAGDAGGEYSHIGIVIREGDKLKIAHSVPGEHDYEGDFDRVKSDAIEIFFSEENASKGAVARLELTPEQKKRLSKMAIAKIQTKTEFDHDYNLDDTTKLYCTEFLQLLYSSIGIELNEGRVTTAFIPGMQGDYIMPSDIYKNRNLKIIYSF